MFNPFKKHKEQSEATESESNLEKENFQEEKKDSQESNLELAKTPDILKDSESIDIRLEALNDYFKECEEKGIEMTPDMVRSEVRDKLGIEVEELLGKEISDPEIKTSHKNIAKDINDLMNQKAEKTKTPLSVLRDKVFKSKAAKVAFVSAMLLLKFNPAAGANNNEKKVVEKDQVKTSIDAMKVVSPDGNDGKTFKTTSEDFKDNPDFEDNPDKVIIKADSNFDSGKAVIKDTKVIASDFEKFLSKIDKDNFASLMSQEWLVKGSSDETKYNKAGGNEKLTNDRINALKTVLEKVMDNHDFSKQLTPDQVKKLLTKEIKEVYPTDGLEKGVTYVTDLINPLTNTNFTDDEVKLIKEKNPQEYKKLLEACRYTNFELAVEDGRMFNADNYDEMVLLVDDSGSMLQTRGNMSQSLDSLSSHKPLKLAFFSDNIDKVPNNVMSSKSASKAILSDSYFNGSGNEKSLSSAIEYMRNFEPTVDGKNTDKGFSSRVLYVATDEALHDTGAILKLEAEAKRTHTDVVFLMFYDKGSKFIKVDLETLKSKAIDSKGNITQSVSDFKDTEGKTIRFNL